MAKSTKAPSDDDSSAKDVEHTIVTLAEKLGWLVGTAEAKTQAALNHPEFREQIARIRDRASALLDHFSAGHSRGRAEAGTSAPEPEESDTTGRSAKPKAAKASRRKS